MVSGGNELAALGAMEGFDCGRGSCEFAEVRLWEVMGQ